MSFSSTSRDSSDESVLHAVRNRAWRTREVYTGVNDREGSVLGTSVTGAEPSPPQTMPSHSARDAADTRTLLEDNARLRQQLHQQYLINRGDGAVREELASSRETHDATQRIQQLQRELEHERSLRRKVESELHATHTELSQHGVFIDREALAVRQSALHATRVADTLRDEKRLAEQRALTLERRHAKLKHRVERLQRKVEWSERKRAETERDRDAWQGRAIHAENRSRFLEEQAKSLETRASTEAERTSHAVERIRAETVSFQQQVEAATTDREAAVARILAQCEEKILHLQKRLQRAKSQRDKAHHKLALERDAHQRDREGNERELRAIKAEWAGLVRRQQADLEETRRAVRNLEDKNKELRTELRRAADAWQGQWAKHGPSDISLWGAIRNGW